MQMIRGTTAGRHAKSGGDRYGRYSWMELQGKNSRRLCIITAYRVTQQKGTRPASADCNTAYWQQVQGMIKDGVYEPDPRNQILTDLTKLIRDKKDQGVRSYS